MMNAEAPGGMPGGIPGKLDKHGFNVGRTARAIGEGLYNNKVMSRRQAIDSLTVNARTEVNEFYRQQGQGLKIDKVPFRTGKAIVTDVVTGEKILKDTVYFAHEANRSYEDVINSLEENGLLRKRIGGIADTIYRTNGDVIWFSPEGDGSDRMYIARHDGKDSGELYSLQLQHKDMDSMWNFLDAFSGKTHDRNGNIKDVVVVRDSRKGEDDLKLEDVVLTYVDRLSIEERKAFAPTIHRLINEAQMPEEIRDRNIAAQERYIRKEVQKLLNEKSTQDALGTIGQSLATWARQLDEKEQSAVKTTGHKITERENIALVKSRSKAVAEKPIALYHSGFRDLTKPIKRHRGHSGGRGFRYWRRLAEQKIAGIEIIPRKGKLKAEEVGLAIIADIKGKIYNAHRPLHRNGSISSQSIFVPKEAKKRDFSKSSLKIFSQEVLDGFSQRKGKRKETIFISTARKVPTGKDRLLKNYITTAFASGSLEGKKVVSKLEAKKQRIRYQRRERLSVEKVERGKFLQPKKELIKTIIRREKRRFKEFVTNPYKFIEKTVNYIKKEIKKRERRVLRVLRTQRKLLKFLETMRRRVSKDRSSILQGKRELRRWILLLYGKESKQYRDFKKGRITKKTTVYIEKMVRKHIRRLEKGWLKERIMTMSVLKFIFTMERKYFRKYETYTSNVNSIQKKSLLKKGRMIISLNGDFEKIIYFISKLKSIFKQLKIESVSKTFSKKHFLKRKKKPGSVEFLLRRNGLNQKRPQTVLPNGQAGKKFPSYGIIFSYEKANRLSPSSFESIIHVREQMYG
ncbi:hypothetical protein HYW54_01315 [Candidatus Gottesmanbacteria bacterium]|nr:hypothetical protein [Candidatus Gottesmanbacteria bacterium]